jgi:hypothetical protein
MTTQCPGKRKGASIHSIEAPLFSLVLPGSPGFPVEFLGVDELHAAFLNESRTLGHVRRSVQEIRVVQLTLFSL